MATKTTTVLVDDLTGEPADTTVRFALDSREYELDLTEKNAAGVSRRFLPVRPGGTEGRRRSSRHSGGQAGLLRGRPRCRSRLAAGQGIEVSPRGRIRRMVIEQYRAAGN